MTEEITSTPVPATNNNDNLTVRLGSTKKKNRSKGQGKICNSVCVSKNGIVKKVKRSTGENLVKTEGYSFAKRSEWKKTVRDVANYVPEVIVGQEVVAKKTKKVKTDKARKSKEET